MKKPYIGITGFMSSREVELVLSAYKKARPIIKSSFGTIVYIGDYDRYLMVGVLANLATLYGQKGLQPNRYPEIGDIKNIFPHHGNDVINLIHYSTTEEGTLFVQMMALTELVGGSLDGFQLNIPWPNPNDLRAYNARYPHKIIVLQIGRKALGMATGTLGLHTCLSAYKGLIDYVLFDPSGGKGEPFNATAIPQCCLRIARDTLGESVGLSVAGGLSSKTLHILEPIIKEFPDISIDAESKLRNEIDNLVIAETESYIKTAFEVLQGMWRKGEMKSFKNC